jgi:hypothetical protein
VELSTIIEDQEVESEILTNAEAPRPYKIPIVQKKKSKQRLLNTRALMDGNYLRIYAAPTQSTYTRSKAAFPTITFAKGAPR